MLPLVVRMLQLDDPKDLDVLVPGFLGAVARGALGVATRNEESVAHQVSQLLRNASEVCTKRNDDRTVQEVLGFRDAPGHETQPLRRALQSVSAPARVGAWDLGRRTLQERPGTRRGIARGPRISRHAWSGSVAVLDRGAGALDGLLRQCGGAASDLLH